MYGINVGKNTIHGSYGVCNPLTKNDPLHTQVWLRLLRVKILKCFDPCLQGTKTFQPLTSIPISTHSMSGSCRRSLTYKNRTCKRLEPEITLEKGETSTCTHPKLTACPPLKNGHWVGDPFLLGAIWASFKG